MQSGFEQGCFSIILKSSIYITQIIKITLIIVYYLNLVLLH
jgi:hypothetical protein